jgi:hypothetical protein
MSGPSAEVLRARAYLSRVAEPPSPALIALVEALVEALGPVEAADRVRAADVPDLVAGETAATGPGRCSRAGPSRPRQPARPPRSDRPAAPVSPATRPGAGAAGSPAPPTPHPLL